MATHPLTRADIRTLVRQRADMENSTFVSDSEINDYVNESIRDLWELLTAIHGEQFVNTTDSIATVAGQATYDLPAEAHKILRVSLELNNTDVPLSPFSYAGRVLDLTPRAWTDPRQVRYHLSMHGYDGTSSGGIVFSPVPNGVYQVNVWYHPRPPELTQDTDPFVLGHDDWLIYDVAIKCLAKEQTDASFLLGLKAQYEQRMHANTSERDVGMPVEIPDVRSIEEGYGTPGDWWY